MQIDDKKLDEILNMHQVPEVDETLQERIVKYAISYPQGDVKIQKQSFLSSLRIGLWQGAYGTAVAAAIFGFIIYTGTDTPPFVEPNIDIAVVKEDLSLVEEVATIEFSESLKKHVQKLAEGTVPAITEDVYDEKELEEFATLDDSDIEEFIYELYEEEEFEEEILSLL
jgi:hypothetical protein